MVQFYYVAVSGRIPQNPLGNDYTHMALASELSCSAIVAVYGKSKRFLKESISHFPIILSSEECHTQQDFCF